MHQKEFGDVPVSVGRKDSTLESNELLLDHIVSMMPDYFFWKDKDLLYAGCNQRFAELVGLKDAAAIIGKSDDDLPWQIHADCFREGDRKVLKGVEVPEREETLTLKGQPPITVVVNKRGIQDSSGVISGIFGIAKNITGYKQLMEELKQSKRHVQESREELLNNIMHDLRTPFTGMVGVLEELTLELADLPKGEGICTLKKTCHLLFNRINQILQWMSSAETTPQSVPFSLSDILDSLIASFQPEATCKLLSLTCEVDRGVSVLQGDALCLKRILEVLIRNAIDFTEKGGVHISAKIIEQEGGCQLICSVQDSGMGIEKSEIERLFEPFVRLKPAYQKSTDGVGLGLTLAKHFLNQMRGTIDVDSQPGKGSCFTFQIPFEYANIGPIPLLGANDTPLKLLVVEDDTVIQHAIPFLFQSFNCQVDIANNGQAALDMIRKNCYGLVLMDLGLPDLSGIEVAQKIRCIYSADTLPIVAWSAHLNPTLEENCQKAQMQGSFTKPLLSSQIPYLLSYYKENTADASACH